MAGHRCFPAWRLCCAAGGLDSPAPSSMWRRWTRSSYFHCTLRVIISRLTSMQWLLSRSSAVHTLLARLGGFLPHGHTPLHLAIVIKRGFVSVDMVRHLLSARPAAASVQSLVGTLPMQLAERNQTGEHRAAIIQLLLDALPSPPRPLAALGAQKAQCCIHCTKRMVAASSPRSRCWRSLLRTSASTS